MENRYSSAQSDLRYFSWYFKNFFSLKKHGFIFIVFWISYLIPRMVFGSGSKIAIKNFFEKVSKKKKREMPFPIGEKIYFMTLRDFSDFDLFHEICVRDFYGTAQFLRPGMTVVDVGANIGAFSVMAGVQVGQQGKVVAFEPEAGNFSMMKENLAANHLMNAVPHEVAISNYDGIGEMFISSNHEGHSLMDNGANLNKMPVAVTTIDGALAKLGVHHVDVLKIDVEGTEIAALEGAAKTIAHNPSIRIMLDALHYPGEEKQIADYMNALGFSTKLVEDFVLAVKQSS